MSPLLGILAGPPAIAALDAAKCAVSAVARPFADVLGALAEHTQPAAAIPDKNDEKDLKDRVADRLQEIFDSTGSEAGDCCSVSYDDVTDRVEVNHGAQSGADAQAAIEADDELMDNLRQMAELDAESKGRVDLLVQVA